MAGTPVRPGQANVTGSATVNFLKLFAGEVIAAFKDSNVMQDIVTVRSISAGKVATFPNTGKAGAFYHTPGVNIVEGTLTSTIATNERLIYVDNRLISAVLLDNWDEAVAHWDFRSVYSTELGRALAKRYDQLALNTTILAARAASNLTNGSGTAIASGGSVTDANLGTQGQNLINALFSSAQILDQNDVPKDERYCVVTPAMFYNIIRDPSVQAIYNTSATAVAYQNPAVFPLTVTTSQGPQFQTSYPMVAGGLADWGRGTIVGGMVAGFIVLPSNHLPNGVNIASGDTFFGTGAASANGNVYYGDFTNTRGVAFHKSALGVVQLRGLTVEQAYMLEYQADLVVAKLMIGMGILRPEAAVELKIA